MPIAQTFPDPRIGIILESFLGIVQDLFGTSLVSVILYGSVVHDDLAPGFGDLDFLTVVEEDLTEGECQRLTVVRQPFLSGENGVLGRMVEGAFMPRRMLNPENKGKGFWWGTRGESRFEANQLGWFVLHMVREQGLVIWGKDVRSEIPVADQADLRDDAQKACENMRKHARGGTLHSVDWLLTAARLLLWLREGRLSSKSGAADWGYTHAKGEWRGLLPRAKYIRLNAQGVDRHSLQDWLRGLREPILQACTEIELELVAKCIK